MDEEDKNLNQPDHDILIELRTEMRGMRTDMKSAADDTKERLLLLGSNKMEKDQFHAWEVSHAKEHALREEAMNQAIRQGADAIKALQTSDTKQTRQLTYMGGILAAATVILTIVGPLLTKFLANLLHL